VTGERPAFLVTVDVEGDDLWSRPRTVTTRNARFLHRFQSLCERHGSRPTYLTTYEMARCPEYREFARDVLARGRGEVGMHLHAWNSPPLVALTEDDHRHQPYLCEYPEPVMQEKVRFLTALLEETFEVPMRAHRAGRWGLDGRYARLLVASGYRVDSSVTPHVSWRGALGHPDQRGGQDYTGFPDAPYFVDLTDIGRAGGSSLLEVPMTTERIPFAEEDAIPGDGGTGPFFVRWLRPNGRSAEGLLRIMRRALREARECVVFMIHSSELMPGGSRVFPRAEDVETLYEHLEALLEEAHRAFDGSTLSEFHDRFRRQAAST
jgi:hypothetical protein